MPKILALPLSDFRLAMNGFHGFTTSQYDPNELRIRITLRPQDGPDNENVSSLLSANVPIRYLGLLRGDAFFRNQKPDGFSNQVGSSVKTIEASSFRLAGLYGAPTDNAPEASQIIGMEKLEEGVGRFAAGEEVSLFSLQGNQALVLDGFSVAVFYFGFFSLFLNEDFLIAASEGNFARFWNLEKTHLEDRTLFLAPNFKYRDRISALLLGILYAEPDLQDLFIRFAKLAYASTTRYCPPFHLPLPEEAGLLKLKLSRPYTLVEPDSVRGMKVYLAKILQDKRTAKFDEIIINRDHYKQNDFSKPSRTEYESKEMIRFRMEFEEDLTFSSASSMKPHHLRTNVLVRHFRGAFPGYRKTKVSCIGEVKTYKRKRSFWLNLIPPMGGRVSAGPADLEPKPEARFATNLEDRPSKGKSFFRSQSGPLPSVETVDVRSLDSTFLQFSRAKRELLEVGFGQCVFGPTESKTEKVFRLPTEWGAFCRLGKGRSRLCSIIELRIDILVAYALEFSNLEIGYGSSIGILARRGGCSMSLEQLAHCAKHACETISAFGTQKLPPNRTGIWPNGPEFSDVDSLAVKHLRRSSHFDLAEKLHRKAANLVDHSHLGVK